MHFVFACYVTEEPSGASVGDWLIGGGVYVRGVCLSPEDTKRAAALFAELQTLIERAAHAQGAVPVFDDVAEMRG